MRRKHLKWKLLVRVGTGLVSQIRVKGTCKYLKLMTVTSTIEHHCDSYYRLSSKGQGTHACTLTLHPHIILRHFAHHTTVLHAPLSSSNNLFVPFFSVTCLQSHLTLTFFDTSHPKAQFSIFYISGMLLSVKANINPKW